MRLVALILVVEACGGGKHAAPSPAPDPIPKTAGASCTQVVAHLATLADRDPTQGEAANEALRARCDTDAWSDEARSCFATAQSEPELDGCKGMLNDRQKQAFVAAPPKKQEKKPDPDHKTRGPVHKDS